jgi:ornithine cyclodeaminase/alanine dehydrogenase-like protein (mu-crystallin family)
MLFLSADQIEVLGDWQSLVQWLFDCHRSAKPKLKDMLMQRGENAWFTRAAWSAEGDLGLKSVTVFPANAQLDPPRASINGAFLLFDGKTGESVAVLDGAALTAWKTVGDSALGGRLLSRPDSRTLLVVGSGTIASRIPFAYLEIRPGIERVIIWNRTHWRAEALAGELHNRLAVPVQATDDLGMAAREADIIVCATMTVEPVLMGDWVRPGTHVDLIGAYRADMREADDKLMRRGRLFVDMRESTIGEIGELMIPMASGVISEKDVLGDFYDLAGESAEPGRCDDKEITIFKNGGGAHLDLMTAKYFFSRAENAAR